MRRGAAVPAALRDSAGPPGNGFSLMQNRERRDAAALRRREIRQVRRGNGFSLMQNRERRDAAALRR